VEQHIIGIGLNVAYLSLGPLMLDFPWPGYDVPFETLRKPGVEGQLLLLLSGI